MGVSRLNNRIGRVEVSGARISPCHLRGGVIASGVIFGYEGLKTQDTSCTQLLTHSAKFHCDDAFAYATLRLALGVSNAGHDHHLVRSRNKAQIAAADIVFDMGAVYDPATGRFDHHQRGAPVREDEASRSAPRGSFGASLALPPFAFCFHSIK